MVNKKRLLVLQPSLAPYRVDLYNFLSERFIFHVILYNPNLDGLAFEKESVEKSALFKFIKLSGGITIGSQVLSVKLIKKIADFKPDIVISHEFGFNTTLAILLRRFYRYKIISTCDDSPIMAANCTGIRKSFRQFAIKHIDGLICINPETVDILETKFPDTKCQFFYFPIIQEEDAIYRKIRDSQSYISKYRDDLDGKAKFIYLFVGRLVPEKSPHLLVKAFAEVASLHDQVSLIIVGDGPEKGTLMNLVAELDLREKIRFTGKLSNVPLFGWFSIADVLVLPSRFEPFGAVVNEALVAGCKAIVSENVGAKCLIEEPNNGYVFGNGNVADLVSKMKLSLRPESHDDFDYRERKNLMTTSFSEAAQRLSDFISN